MNEIEEKLNNALAERMKESVLEIPSVDFTAGVLNEIKRQEEAARVVTTYVPLISKKAWMAIAAIFIVVFLYVLFTGSEVNLWENAIATLKTKITDYFTQNSWSPEVPNTLVYGIIILTTLIFVEIPILRRQLRR